MTTPTRVAIRRPRRRRCVMSASSITGLVRKRWQTSSAWARAARLVGGLDAEADGLADPHAVDAVEPERRQRPLDRGPLRIGDPRSQPGLHEDREEHAPSLLAGRVRTVTRRRPASPRRTGR